MLPLSCLNCCHNPLQLGPIGTAFGYCTRHNRVLNQPHATTCGQLLRKDLLFEAADRERALHARRYRRDRVVSLVPTPTSVVLDEAPNGQLPADPVVEEVRNFGSLDSKIGTMAALRRVEGTRAEVAMLSLSRGYFRNCVKKGGRWTAGVHLLFWTLKRLDEDPVIEASDVRGPIAFSLGHTVRVARWSLVAYRLAFVSDVGRIAAGQNDRAGTLADLPGKAVGAAGNDPDKLLAWLSKRRASWSAALSPSRYATLQATLRKPD